MAGEVDTFSGFRSAYFIGDNLNDMCDDTKKIKAASSGLQLLRIGNGLKGRVCIHLFDHYNLIT